VVESCTPVIRHLAQPPSRGYETASRQYAEEIFGKHFSGQAVAQVAVEAVDQEAANALAQHELRLALDVINFYGDLIHPLSNRVRVCMRGESYRILDGHLGLHLGDQPTYTVGEVVRGPLDLLNWAAMDADKSKKYGFQRIAGILSQSRRSALEDRMLSSFQWAGRASVDDRREQAFLLYAIALESLLLGSKFDAEVGYRLRLRCAHLLGIGIDGKKRIMKSLSDLYSTRSKIVHSGSFEVTDGDLSLMRFVAKNALIAVLTEAHFQSLVGEEQFEQWFEDKILDAPVTTGLPNEND
jgi:hypothetical protein